MLLLIGGTLFGAYAARVFVWQENEGPDPGLFRLVQASELLTSPETISLTSLSTPSCQRVASRMGNLREKQRRKCLVGKTTDNEIEQGCRELDGDPALIRDNRQAAG